MWLKALIFLKQLEYIQTFFSKLKESEIPSYTGQRDRRYSLQLQLKKKKQNV